MNDDPRTEKAAGEAFEKRVAEITEEFWAEVAKAREIRDDDESEAPEGVAVVGVAVRRIMGLEAGIEKLVDRIRVLEGKPPFDDGPV